MFVLTETLRPADEQGLTTTDIPNSTLVCDNVKRSVQTGKIHKRATPTAFLSTQLVTKWFTNRVKWRPGPD